MDKIDVFSSGLKADKCLFKNEIRSGPLLGGVVLIISSVFRLYTAPLFCSPSFTGLCSSCAEIWFINNIFAVQKKKQGHST
jgi:hypothetical protein